MDPHWKDWQELETEKAGRRMMARRVVVMVWKDESAHPRWKRTRRT